MKLRSSPLCALVVAVSALATERADAGLCNPLTATPIEYDVTGLVIDTAAATCTGSGPFSCDNLRVAITAVNADALNCNFVIHTANFNHLMAGSHEDNNANGDLDILGTTHPRLIKIVSDSGFAIIDALAVSERVLDIANDGNLTVELHDLLIRNGAEKSITSAIGGGIRNQGATLAIFHSYVSGNVAEAGAGIFNQGQLTLSGATISSNQLVTVGATNPAGAGVFTMFDMTATNSTFDDNTDATTNGQGGGLYINSAVTATLSNCTFYNNQSVAAGGGLTNFQGILSLFNVTIGQNTSGFGGGLYNSVGGGLGSLAAYDSIIAKNTPTDCAGDSSVSHGFNLDSDTSCAFGASGDQTADPAFGSFANHGGEAWTLALLGSSPAIDHGNPAGCTGPSGAGILASDACGTTRYGTCDAGAYEFPGACGDGVTQTSAGEQCDDSNSVTETCSYGQTSCAVCDATCHSVAGATHFCGDSMVQIADAESCDDGNAVTEACAYGVMSCSVCDAACHTGPGMVTSCGDGALQAAVEQCDDGNAVTETCTYGQTSCNVCDASCHTVAGVVSFCGDGAIQAGNGEQCDDSNTMTETCAYGMTACTVCDASCHSVAGAATYCGDGATQSGHGEQCDDGNMQSGDGCSSACQAEAPSGSSGASGTSGTSGTTGASSASGDSGATTGQGSGETGGASDTGATGGNGANTAKRKGCHASGPPAWPVLLALTVLIRRRAR